MSKNKPVKWKCKKCGAISKKKPHLFEIEFPHPDGAVTVLGRKVELVPLFSVWNCSKCSATQLAAISFPLDPDALLIGKLFDVNHSDIPLDDIVAYLKQNNITRNDLEELATLKDDALAVLEWWTKRGLDAPVIAVPPGLAQHDDPFLASVREQGIKIIEEEHNVELEDRPKVVRLLRPALD